MRFSVVRPQLQRGFKVLDRAARLTQIVARVAAVHECGRIAGINFDGACIGLFCLPRMSGMRVHVTFDQGQIAAVGKYRLKLLRDLERIVVAVQEEEIICKVDRGFRIVGQLLDNFVAQVSGLLELMVER